MEQPFFTVPQYRVQTPAGPMLRQWNAQTLEVWGAHMHQHFLIICSPQQYDIEDIIFVDDLSPSPSTPTYSPI
jgi:hypothetical protein